MAKDPAFLFYFQDFIVGTSDMSNEEIGAYIKCLCFQAAKGGITNKHMLNICNSHDIHNIVKTKFILNSETGLYENQRLKLEIEKRRAYSESRANNRKGAENTKKHMNNISKSYDKHMEDVNINENENEIVIEKGIDDRKIDFFNLVGMQYSNEYSESLLKEFCEYWSEHNPNGKRMRFEMEKVFDISRRLKTWSKNNFSNNGKPKSKLDGYEQSLARAIELSKQFVGK